MDVACISYKDTGAFSPTVIDYLEDKPELREFYSNRPTLDGFDEFLKNKQVIADRNLLADTLDDQYQITLQYARIWDPEFSIPQPVQQNIESLRSDNTYTITTGHQLNIFAGPLYFIYKIVTAIKLARQLKEQFPGKNFVPVYWMASEDHDFAEISYTTIGGKKVHWWLESSGATGRIHPETMRQALNQYKGVLGMEHHAPELAAIVETEHRLRICPTSTAFRRRFGMTPSDAGRQRVRNSNPSLRIKLAISFSSSCRSMCAIYTGAELFIKIQQPPGCRHVRQADG